MIILGIETSCDETAISLIEAEGKLGQNFVIKILANEILSQIALHRKYGGVFPSLAKREHSKNLTPLFKKVLEVSNFWESIIKDEGSGEKTTGNYSDILKNIGIDEKREPELWKQFFDEIPKIQKPPIDLIAVTEGPGLEPALWTGINFGKALSAVWQIPLLPINHMEGHIFASLLKKDAKISNSPDSSVGELISNLNSQTTNYELQTTNFPSLALLVSGGHTELISVKNWFDYEILGETLDDAVGEAFDKVARIIGLPYPGGPEISKLAKSWRAAGKKGVGFKFPRPMINSPDLNFSFSGLKTSVLYTVQKLPKITPDIRAEIAAAFEDSAIEVLVTKTKRALEKIGGKCLILGGGVAANLLLREKLLTVAEKTGARLFVPEISHATDNALMIAVAAGVRKLTNRADTQTKGTVSKIKARGNLKL